jgi:hypothetical protein
MVEWCDFSTPKMASRGGVAQQGLIGGHMIMDAHRTVALCGFVVASMVGMTRAMH